MSSLRKPVALFLCGLIVAGGAVGLAPRPAHAQLFGASLVLDPVNLVQNTISAVANAKTLLNPIFYRIAQAAIQSMVRSTVNWINNGFEGSPAFATDLKYTLLDAADREAERFVRQIGSDLSISSPFQNRIAQNVLAAYYLSTSRDGFALANPYTLNRVSEDDAAFLRGDFTKGGFSAWFAATLNLPNTPRGFNELARSAFYDRVADVKGQIHEEVGWGDGFLSWRKCDKEGTKLVDNSKTSTITTLDGKQEQLKTLNLQEKKTCLESHIETPGSIISSAGAKALGLGADSLIQADSFDEIVNALLGQLMNQVLGGGGGLRGVSRPSAARGGGTYFDQQTSTTASAGVSVVSSFTQILDEQATQIQIYLRNWQTISAAAVAAKAALEASTCTANKDSIISTQIEPVITRAATIAGSIPSVLSEIERIRSSALSVVTDDTTEQLTVLQQANADYQNLLSNTAFPSVSDMTYAIEQSQDTGNETPASLLTELNRIAAQARCST